MSFRFYFPSKNLRTRNMTPTQGARDLLRILFRGDETIVPVAGNFYLGLCNQIPAETDVLTSVSTEPTIGVNGYARVPIARTAVGWPTELVINNAAGVRAIQTNFLPAGGAFDAAISRAFLTDQETGFTGSLFCYSGGLTTAITLEDGVNFPVEMEYYLD